MFALVPLTLQQMMPAVSLADYLCYGGSPKYGREAAISERGREAVDTMVVSLDWLISFPRLVVVMYHSPIGVSWQLEYGDSGDRGGGRCRAGHPGDSELGVVRISG